MKLNTGARFKKPKRKETEIQAEILNLLKRRGIFAYNSKNQGTWNAAKSCYIYHGLQGVPDITGFLPGGRALYIEVKRPGENLREGYFTKAGKYIPGQTDFRDIAIAQGTLYILARSIEDVESALPPPGVVYVWCTAGEPCAWAIKTGGE